MFKLQKFFGFLFISFGLILLLNSFSGFTGMVVFEEVSYRDSSLFGILLIVIGILIIKSQAVLEDVEEHTQRIGVFRGRRALRIHNDQAHYAARRHFMENHGRAPTKEEIREYTRKIHEKKHYLGEIVDDYRHTKSA